MKAAEEMKREQKEVKLRMILQDYHRRNDYELQQAVNDILALDALPPAEGAAVAYYPLSFITDAIASEQQPTAEGGNLNLDGINYSDLPIPKPSLYPAEGAEEINKMIGQAKDSISKRYNKNYWEILGDYHSNGRLTTNDFIDELLNEFATLHAQKIADKMVGGEAYSHDTKMQ